MPSSRKKRERAKQVKRLTEAQAVLGWSVILLLVALLGAIYLSQASSIAAVGRKVQSLQNRLEDLKRENSELERQIAEAQSLERLEEEALRLGFSQATSTEIEYVIVPNYPVEITAVEEQSGMPAKPAETFEEVLWLAVKDRIGNMIYGEASDQ
jgi:cell division protein FtsL